MKTSILHWNNTFYHTYTLLFMDFLIWGPMQIGNLLIRTYKLESSGNFSTWHSPIPRNPSSPDFNGALYTRVYNGIYCKINQDIKSPRCPRTNFSIWSLSKLKRAGVVLNHIRIAGLLNNLIIAKIKWIYLNMSWLS